MVVSFLELHIRMTGRCYALFFYCAEPIQDTRTQHSYCGSDATGDEVQSSSLKKPIDLHGMWNTYWYMHKYRYYSAYLLYFTL